MRSGSWGSLRMRVSAGGLLLMALAACGQAADPPTDVRTP